MCVLVFHCRDPRSITIVSKFPKFFNLDENLKVPVRVEFSGIVGVCVCVSVNS